MGPTNSHEEALDKVKQFFDEKVTEFGAAPKGVDYNSAESQEIRFEQLLKIVITEKKFSILDYGCGYGALAYFLEKSNLEFDYIGYDISAEMIKQAKQNKPKSSKWKFTTDISVLPKADYSVASGIFNKIFGEKDSWESIIIKTLNNFVKYSKHGFSFNMLTSYSDKEYMRPDLYYADPLYYFDYCKKNLSRNVALLHDYELYDFTILVSL